MNEVAHIHLVDLMPTIGRSIARVQASAHCPTLPPSNPESSQTVQAYFSRSRLDSMIGRIDVSPVPGEVLMMKLAAVSSSILLVLLAGCNPTPVDAPETAPAEVAVEDQAGASPPQEADPALPPGVTIPAPSVQRSTHSYTTKAGKERRVVFYEFLDGDVPAMAETLERSMAEAGFSARRGVDTGDGKTRIIFVKNGYGRVNGAVTSSIGDKPKVPSAKGVYSLDMPAAGEPDATITSG